MPYTYTLVSVIPATAQEIYETWLDSLGHAEMTGSEAVMSEELGAEVSAWDGYITGRNLELVPGERIVQSWRTTKFSDEHGDSIITVTLEETDGETLLTLEHSNVPDEQRNYEEGGWEANYFEPMRLYFGSRAPSAEEAPEPAADVEPAPAMAPKPAKPKSQAKATQSKTKSQPKPKAKPKAKSAPAPAPKRKPPKPSAAKKPKGKTAPRKPAKSKASKPAKPKSAKPKTATRKPAKRPSVGRKSGKTAKRRSVRGKRR